jgi:hypothetical protein
VCDQGRASFAAAVASGLRGRGSPKEISTDSLGSKTNAPGMKGLDRSRARYRVKASAKQQAGIITTWFRSKHFANR